LELHIEKTAQFSSTNELAMVSSQDGTVFKQLDSNGIKK